MARPAHVWRRMGVALCVSMLLGLPVRAADLEVTDFSELSLEELMRTEIVSASKKRQPLIEVPSAIYVVHKEDIRRSGHSSLPELLRMVPGLHVGRISGSNWTISARGFNSIFANKLLVMIDGRSVYTPLFAGTYWALQDLPLSSIERIEVIRGPGSSVWGANAVNGVINIITRRAEDTQGTRVESIVGTEDRTVTSIEHGTAPWQDAHLRFGASYRNTDGTVDSAGVRQSDDFRFGRGEFRLDWLAQERDQFSLLGGWYGGDKGATNRRDNPTSLATGFGAQIVDTTGRLNGADLQFRWRRTHSELSSTELRIVTDYHHRNVEIFTQRRRNLYVDWQHEVRLRERHEVVWGLGWRGTSDRIDSSLNLQFRPEKQEEVLYSGFVQDEIQLVPEKLSLTIGSKVEWNTYTGWEIQPTARFMYRPAASHQIWGAVTRAVRMPARADRELVADITTVVPGAPFGPPGCPCPAGVGGNPKLDSEVMTSYELGYRTQVGSQLHLDFATFFSDYENLRGFATSPSNPFFLVANNRRQAQSWGVEISARWQVTRIWLLSASYTATRARDSAELRPIEFDVPEDQYQLSSRLDLPGGLELDAAVYYVGSYEVGIPTLELDRYVRTDVRIGWSVRPGLDLSVGVQNLFDRQHAEARDFVASMATEIERNVYVKLGWRF